MCNIISDQKPLFACKGICPNCRCKSELAVRQPEQRSVALLPDFIFQPPIISVITANAGVPVKYAR
jgi:hypothetical protein